MRIRSRFKDYYDYIQHIYGGGDPNLVYNREIIEDPDGKKATYHPRGVVSGSGFCLPKEFDQESLHHIPNDWSSTGSYLHVSFIKEGESVKLYKSLAVAGRMFILQQEKLGVRDVDSVYGAYGKVVHDWHVVDRLEIKHSYGPPSIYQSGHEIPALMELSKHVKAPVFVYDQHDRTVRVEVRVPSLGDLGLAAFVPADQLYQELAMFMGKLYSDNPDMMPAVEQTNIQKVEAHGFDKKQSFRHRK